MSVFKDSKDNMSRKKAMKDILAYEDQITIETEKAVHKIRDRAKLMHSEIDKFITDMLTQLKHKFEREMTRIRAVIDKLKSGYKSSNSRSSSLDRIQRSHQATPKAPGIDFGLQSNSFDQDIVFDAEAFEKKRLRFIEGDFNESNFQKLFGYFLFEDTSTIPLSLPVKGSVTPRAKSEVKLIKTFQCGDRRETVHAIAPVNEDQAWVCCGWGSRKLTLFDRFGDAKKSATLDMQINDAATFNDGTEDIVLVSSYREKSIKRLNQEFLKTTDFAYISLFPGGISWDRRNGLYVCFRDSYHRPVSFGSRRMVAKMTKHGEIVQTVEKDDDQKNVFGYPFRVAVNINGDVCVSDYGDGTRGVTILNKDGRLKACYKGPPTSLSMSQPFLPHGICCDEDGFILVSDWNNDCVHLLDADGNFLMYLLTQKDGVKGPNAIAVDKRGEVWVGDSDGRMRVFKYSIYDA